LVTVWTTWAAEEKGCDPDIVSYEARELDEKLQKLFAEVRKNGRFRLRARQFAGNDSVPEPVSASQQQCFIYSNH